MANGIKYQTHEVLNKVLNSGEDALNVDIDNVTLTTEGGDVAIDVALDKANDSVTIYANTAADGSGDSTVPLVDAAGNLQIDIVSSALPSGGATAANQSTIIGHVDGVETLLGTIDSDTNDIKTDMAAIEVLLTAANVDHAANEALLITIDEDTNAIKGHVDGIETLITSTNSKIDTFDAVLDNILTKNTEIDAVLDTIKTDTEEIEGAVETIETAIKAEDAAHSSGDNGIMALAVRNDDVAALAGADGDYSPLQVNAAGSLYTKDETGEAGSILVTGTTAVTSPSNTKFIAIQFIEDNVFDSGNDGLISATNQLYPSTQYTGTDIDADGGAVADSVSFPQGMTIFGRWSGFKLASGKVIGYIGYV